MYQRKNSQKKLFRRLIIVLLALFILSGAAYGSYLYLSYQDAQATAEKEQQVEDKLLADAKSATAAAEAKKNEPVYITLPGADKILAYISDYTQPENIWMIVSKTHPISTDYVPANLKIPDVETRTDKSDAERSARSDIETPIKDMFEAASESGYSLMIGSGYRSAALQATYFNSLARSVGEEVANQTIARPGQSEHQTGLAIDLTTVSRYCYLSECFASTPEGIWLAANSYKYGFILRYPEEKVSVTGYSYEPWHFRYVGVELATALHQSGLALDEAWPYLETALATLKTNGAVQ